jgi:hypothetical protein
MKIIFSEYYFFGFVILKIEKGGGYPPIIIPTITITIIIDRCFKNIVQASFLLGGSFGIFCHKMGK